MAGWKKIEINWDDCPWITEDQKEQARKEFAGQPDFLNSVAGYDFMPLVEDAVINGKALDECLANPPERKQFGEMHAFCDFAWSGAGNENVVALRRGNVLSIEKAFHCAHLISSVKNPSLGICEIFIAEFLRIGFTPSTSSQISGDEHGGGRLVMDELDRMGWYLNRCNTMAAANDPDHYDSVGSEIWYEAGKHITLKTFILPNDQIFRGQALSRKRIYSNRGKLAVESKERMLKDRGIPSPDRADAVFGAMMPGGGYGAEACSWAKPMPMGRPMSIGMG